MTKINYQALREVAEKATPGNWWIDSHGQAMVSFVDNEVLEVFATDNNRNAVRHEDTGNLSGWRNDNDATFIATANPATVLALLDELERNQQYIKNRDQENEDIALTVGKLRVELEAAENNLIDSECHVAELEEALRDKQALLEASEKRIAELEAEPVSQAYNLPELIEGMEVSIDVSTCDADLGNRYFGTVTEASELDTAKNGYILLVQDAEPNFDVNGKSPVTPDGWISCSDRMPAQDDWILIYSKHGEYMAGQVQGEYVELSDGTLSWLGNALYWMPLPEPPQEVNRG